MDTIWRKLVHSRLLSQVSDWTELLGSWELVVLEAELVVAADMLLGLMSISYKCSFLSRGVSLGMVFPNTLFFFFGSFLNTSIIHKTAQLRPLSCQSVLFLAKTRSRTRFSSCDRRTNCAVVEQRDRRNGESVHFRFRA